MNKTAPLFLVAAMLLLTAVPFAESISPPFYVIGFVVDERGAPVENATVEAYLPGGAPVGAALSNQDGYYQISVSDTTSLGDGSSILVRAFWETVDASNTTLYTPPASWANITIWMGAVVELSSATGGWSDGVLEWNIMVSNNGVSNATIYLNITSTLSLQNNDSSHHNDSGSEIWGYGFNVSSLSKLNITLLFVPEGNITPGAAYYVNVTLEGYDSRGNKIDPISNNTVLFHPMEEDTTGGYSWDVLSVVIMAIALILLMAILAKRKKHPVMLVETPGAGSGVGEEWNRMAGDDVGEGEKQ